MPSPTTQPRTAARRAARLALPLALLAAACASGDERGESALPEQDLRWKRPPLQDQRKIGFVLTELDNKLNYWIQLVNGATSPQDAERVRSLEMAIRTDVREYEEAITEQLLAGPPNNRRVAAASLGFSGSKDALAPLLAALTDRDDEVIANALLSLATLADRATPVQSIANLVTQSESVEVRNNATRALRALTVKGLAAEDRETVRTAARLALLDQEAPVRVTGIVLLAELRDFESIDAVTAALGDDVPHVARAASASAAWMGSVEPSVKGKAARALSAALMKVDKGKVRPFVLQNLQQLSGKNYGNEAEPWVEWANKMP